MDIKQFIGPSDRVLLVAPHADDEVLGAGGLLSIAKEAGAKVYVLYVTCSGFKPTRGGVHADLDSRRKELENSVSSIGIDGYDVLFWGEEFHLKLDTVPMLDIVRWLEIDAKVSYSKIRPTIFLVPSGKHNHQDHRAVFEACVSLARTNPFFEDGKLCVLSYEIPGVGQTGIPAFDPTFYVEMDERMIARKCELFTLYQSQVVPKPHMRSTHAIRTLAQYRGVEAGYEFAEAFEIMRLKYNICR